MVSVSSTKNQLLRKKREGILEGTEKASTAERAKHGVEIGSGVDMMGQQKNRKIRMGDKAKLQDFHWKEVNLGKNRNGRNFFSVRMRIG